MNDPITPGSSLRGQAPSLLLLAATGLIAIVTETLPAGLLEGIAQGLDVSRGTAGLLVGAYALGTVLAALPLIIATRRIRRRRLLLAGLAGLVVFNALTAVSDQYLLTLSGRFLAGACSGLLWGLTPGYARAIAQGNRTGRALAIAGVGTPVALSLGTPAGAFVSMLIGWRWTFGALSLLGVALFVLSAALMPDAPRDPSEPVSTIAGVARRRGVRPVLAVVVLWMLGHNALYTYLAPFLSTDDADVRVDAALLVFGVAAVAGIGLVSFGIDRWLQVLAPCAVGVFVLAMLGLALRASRDLVLPLLLLWGAAFGSASPLLNTAMSRVAGAQLDIAATLVSTAWNAAIFGGALIGAALVTLDPVLVADAALLSGAAALLVIVLTRRRAFPAEPTPRK